jgi:hypothetical protein
VLLLLLLLQHLIDFSTYKLSVGNWCNIDLAAALNGQPLQLTVYDTSVSCSTARSAAALHACTARVMVFA